MIGQHREKQVDGVRSGVAKGVSTSARELEAIPRRLDFLDLAIAHSHQRSLDAVAPAPHKGNTS